MAKAPTTSFQENTMAKAPTTSFQENTMAKAPTTSFQENTMAKAPNTPAASPAIAASGGFDLGLEVPAVKRSTGNGGNSERRDKLMRMPIGASFLETVNVPESIKDDAEREKAFNDLCRKLSNSLSGAGRRVSKADAAYNFEVRTVNDPKLGKGVRIWRTAPKTAAAPSPATAGDNQDAASA